MDPNFQKLIADFVNDMKVSFPEYAPVLDKWYAVKSTEFIYSYCQNVYNQHHQAILYRTDSLFNDSNNTEFLPGISFSYLWRLDDLSEKHRNMIWNYLQMVLISVMNNDEVTEPTIHKTINTLEESFSHRDEQQQPTPSNLPPEFMNTKLANIAKEIALETTSDFTDLKDVTDINSAFQTLFKDPEKLMSIVKNVSEKLETKMKSGDLNESELMSEATMMMSQMKDFPGMSEMMNNMAASSSTTSKKNKKRRKQTDEDKKLNEFYNQFMNASR